ncbi:hypothetical protein [Clostridium algidicarnis]|uniref:Uncharacterized protein n=1 Tax=Clostridium algidicarnis DSM 15099 TaxID=1121295 RepID=A0A2S6FVG3_9CLOT|nr:hypothetical protein [Clostridium algidicarnis]PPK46357.1 hypothetical protein BD821_1163 [Clostridium algidicarnis DSM 15099]
MEEQIMISDDINEVLQMLRKIKIDINVPSDASRSDKGLYNLLIEGTKENDFKKVYSFVQSVEMGCGFYSSETTKVKQIYDKAIEANQDEVIEILNGRSEIIDIVYNCYCIQKELKIKLLQSPQLTNGYVIFELIRQLLNNIQLPELNDSTLGYKKIIADGIIKLALIDARIFRYFVKKFEYKEQFYHVMGIALSGMPTIGRQTYVKTITLTKQDNTYYNYVRTLLQGIEESSYDSFITDIKEIIYQRWNEYLSLLLENKEFVSKIIINSYADLILNCFCRMYQDEKLFFLDLDNVIIQFNRDIYGWHGKGTEFSSMYYIYATKLFFFKKIQEVNKISLANRKDIYDKVKSLFDNNYMMHNKYKKVDDIILNYDI